VKQTSRQTAGSKNISAGRISLNKYIMRIPYFIIVLLFVILVFILEASAVFLEKQAVNHADRFVETFLKNNEEIFSTRNYTLQGRKIDQLLAYPSVLEIEVYNIQGALIFNRQKETRGIGKGLFKLSPIVVEKKIEAGKNQALIPVPARLGRMRVTMSTVEESSILQTFALVLLGIFFLFSAVFFLFIRHYNKGMKKELLLLKDSIEKKVEVESLQTKMFNIEELALIQRKIKSDSKDLRLLKEELEKKEHLALIGNFASSIVHDIRNPLIVIGGYADMLKSKVSKKERKFTEKIIDSASVIERLLEDILTFVREQQLELKIGNHRAELVVQAAMDFLEPALKQKSVKIVRELESGVPVSCDMDRLSRAIINLMKNSIENSPAGGTIILKAYRDKGAVVFSVKDMGPGIPEGIQEMVFEPFITADKNKGTGLGLFIARNIAVAHNGTISFETGSSGTEFFIKIPA
jgi:signal transduction histidine kinase